MSFEKLIEDYAIVVIGSLTENVSLDDEGIYLNELILKLEQDINPNLTDVDWGMFDYAYINTAFEIRTDMDNPYDINDNYAAVLLGTAEESGLTHALDFVDNNRNGGKQVMEQIFSSSFLRTCTSKNEGGSLQYYSYAPENNPMGRCWLAITLFKKPINVTDIFGLGNYTVDINDSIHFSYELTPSVSTWSGYNTVNVVFLINNIQYDAMVHKSGGKYFEAEKSFDPPIVDINGTEITHIYITYIPYSDETRPQGVTIYTNGNNTGDGKAYINGLTFIVDGYV
jgi:hypothetical protein